MNQEELKNLGFIKITAYFKKQPIHIFTGGDIQKFTERYSGNTYQPIWVNNINGKWEILDDLVNKPFTTSTKQYLSKIKTCDNELLSYIFLEVQKTGEDSYGDEIIQIPGIMQIALCRASTLRKINLQSS